METVPRRYAQLETYITYNNGLAMVLAMVSVILLHVLRLVKFHCRVVGPKCFKSALRYKAFYN